MSVVPTTLLQNFWGGCGFLALLLIAPTQHTLSLSSQAWLPIAYLALGCSALAFLLYTFGLTRLGPGQAVGILNLVPIFGVLWAAVIAGEQLTIHTIAGAAVIVAGVAMSASTPRRGRHVAPRALKNPSPVLSRPSRITDGVSS